MPKAAAKGKAKAKPGKKPDKPKGGKGKQGGDPVGKPFPLEKGPTPSKLSPKDITNIYKLPDGNLKTEEDVIDKVGYKLEEKLDAGGFGVIFLARNKKTKLRTACKVMELGTDWNDTRVRDMKNELFIMEKVKHLYVVKLFAHFLTQSKAGNKLFIMMELADGGNLAKFIQKKGILTEAEAKLYFAQIVCGINHMHSLGISHRDIKLQNVLLVTNSRSISGDYTLLMADFGLSRIIHHEADGAIAPNRTVCGTPLFMAPEILLRKPYNAFSTDIWALGITVYILVTLEIPYDFQNITKAIQCMVDKKWDWPSKKMKAKPSDQLRAITNGMLEPEPSKRFTLSQLYSHKWITQEFKKAQVLANKK